MAGRMMIKIPSVAAVTRWAVSSCYLLISVPSPLHAEDLPDPTRPQAGIIAPFAGVGAGRGATENRSSGLHTIIISETRRAAIIDGKTVELGGAYGDAKLIEVSEGGVVLQRAQSRQVLTLFPGVKITRKETAEIESAEPGAEEADKASQNMESPNKELPIEQPLPASKDAVP
jgi:MSHA biogenesis protein MshK